MAQYPVGLLVWLGACWLLTGVTTGWDLAAHYFTHTVSADVSELAAWSAAGRWGRTVCLGLALGWVWQKPHTRRDAALLTASLTIAIVADYFLILEKKLVVGIAIFGIMQIVLIIRHLANIRQFRQHRKWCLSGALAHYALWAISIGTLAAPLAKVGLLLPVAVYALLLISATWTAWCAVKLGALPARAGWAAWAGMACFVVCDATVGMGAVWSGTPHGDLIRAFTGLAYTPALTGLVLSGRGRVL